MEICDNLKRNNVLGVVGTTNLVSTFGEEDIQKNEFLSLSFEKQ